MAHSMSPLRQEPSSSSEAEDFQNGDRREVLVDALKTAFENVSQCTELRLKTPLSWIKPSLSSKTHLVDCPREDVDLEKVIQALNREKGNKVDRQLEQRAAMGHKWWNALQDEVKGKEKDWFDMASCEINDEVKRDLEVLSMRGAFNPKRHYKNIDKIKDAKWLQMGTVLDNPVEGNRGRLPKRLRKRTLTQEWLADPEMGHELQKQYLNITTEEHEMDKLRAKQYPLMERRHKRKR